MFRSAESLIVEHHGVLLRLSSQMSGRHFSGLGEASRFLKARGLLSHSAAKKFIVIDNAFNVVRHITPVSIDSFTSSVFESLKGMRKDVISPVMTTSEVDVPVLQSEESLIEKRSTRFDSLLADNCFIGNARLSTDESSTDCSIAAGAPRTDEPVDVAGAELSRSAFRTAAAAAHQHLLLQSGPMAAAVDHELESVDFSHGGLLEADSRLSDDAKNYESIDYWADGTDCDEETMKFLNRLDFSLDRQMGWHQKYYLNGRHLCRGKSHGLFRGRRNALSRHRLLCHLGG